MIITTTDMEKLKYPIGRFIKPNIYSEEIIEKYINTIELFPEQLKKEVNLLTESQLNTHYRPGGWTIKQVVHHCAESHMNGFIRLKLTLTENKPIIKPYNQDLFAELSDVKNSSIESSLKILEGVHFRWVVILRYMDKNSFEKSYFHPEYNKEFSLNESTGSYAWHCNHHLAHITTLKQAKNWT